ncbi:MAG: hypothetical protein AB1696_26845 [Planctomycetota bacterium]
MADHMSSTADKALAEWLIEHGGPVVRYRAATELLDAAGETYSARLARDLLESPVVRRWLDLLERRRGVGGLHSSRPDAFENAMGKLFELGLRAGITPLDRATEPFRRWLAEKLRAGAVQSGDFYARLVAGTLARGGYLCDDAVLMAMKETLEHLSRTARKGWCDIWLSRRECAGFPKSCRGKPFIKREFQFGGKTPLPLIHDIYGFTGLAHDRVLAHKINAVVGYILRPEFQKLPDGYGYIFDERKRQPWAHGWGVHLPGPERLGPSERETSRFLQRLELMAHFPQAVKSDWFARALRHLDRYQIEQGTYRFPSGFLKEQTSGYYVGGAYMGLGENRRSRRAIEIESTFRVLKIRHLARTARTEPTGPAVFTVRNR